MAFSSKIESFRFLHMPDTRCQLSYTVYLFLYLINYDQENVSYDQLNTQKQGLTFKIYHSLGQVAQRQKYSHDISLFSFYLKTNAENQILQGHIITKRNKTFTEDSPVHLHPPEPFVSIIELPA